ncbi:MAG: protein TolR [Bdellovibrionota bacterium]|nr:protein TolR [Pseudobdellovibrionaceae bacterium]|tara:strand:- start:47882 stop:48295 length:414 start_codon:yes stop_codon:yes gene_type:complete
MGMSGGSGKSRMSISEINVTPLVDVMLVLLIIFMVTAPMMKQGIEVDVPETNSSGVSTPEDPFIMSVNVKGEIFIEKTKIPINSLSTKLKAIFQSRKSKEVFIQADKKVEYGIVAETMAEVRAAGLTKIALITQPKN